jgi:hypothetical protein
VRTKSNVEAVEVGGMKAVVHSGVETSVESLALAGVIGVAGVLVTTRATGTTVVTRAGVSTGASRSTTTRSSGPTAAATVVDAAAAESVCRLDEGELCCGDEGECRQGRGCLSRERVHGCVPFLIRQL